MVKILEFGDLIATGEYRLESRFKNHINFSSSGKLLTLTDIKEDAGPLNLVLSDLNFNLPKTLTIKPDHIKLNNQVLPFKKSHKYNSTLNFNSLELDKILSALDHLQEYVFKKGSTSSLKHLLQETASAPSGTFLKVLLDTIAKGFKILLSGELSKGTKSIKGRGFGLTPSGDDLLTGLLYGLHLLQCKGYDLSLIRKEIYESSQTGNFISVNYLSLAYQGRYFADLKRLLTALIEQDKKNSEHYLGLYLNKGETSGSDLLTGLLLTLLNRTKFIELNENRGKNDLKRIYS